MLTKLTSSNTGSGSGVGGGGTIWKYNSTVEEVRFKHIWTKFVYKYTNTKFVYKFILKLNKHKKLLRMSYSNNTAMLTWGLIIRHILVENPSFIVFNQGSPMVAGTAEHQHGRRQRRKLKRSLALARWSSRKVHLHWHWLKPTRNAKNLGAITVGLAHHCLVLMAQTVIILEQQNG